VQAIQFNYPAVLAAALVCFLVGGVWYSPFLFARAWMREAGLDEARIRDGKLASVFALALLCSLVIAFNLAAFIGPQHGVVFGAFAGLAAGLGWAAMSIGVIFLFERRSFRLWLIHAGYLVVSYTAMGALIGAWR
jgi:membrane-associated HD superfamily phosphohydrolase